MLDETMSGETIGFYFIQKDSNYLKFLHWKKKC